MRLPHELLLNKMSNQNDIKLLKKNNVFPFFRGSGLLMTLVACADFMLMQFFLLCIFLHFPFCVFRVSVAHFHI